MAIKNIIARGIGFDNAGDSTTIFIPTGGFTAGVGVVVPPPTVNYQGDGDRKKHKKRRNRTYELFRDMECTIRTTMAGTVVVDAAYCPTVAPSVDGPRTYDAALAELLATAGEYQDLSARVEVLRRDLAAYEAAQWQKMLEDDEDTWMLM